MTIKTAARQCAHYWLIEGTSGPVSKGRCRKCGTTQEFKNSWQGTATHPLSETKPHYSPYSRAAYDTSLMARCRVNHYDNRGID